MMKVEAHYPLFRSKTTHVFGVLLGFVVVVAAVTQLFGFEDFYRALEQFWLMTRDDAVILASLVIVAEIFSLPFLLGMKLSFAMRGLSAFLLLATTAFWAAAAVIGVWVVKEPVDTGFLGAIVATEAGVGFLLFATVLVGGATIYFAQTYIDSHRLHQHLRKRLK